MQFAEQDQAELADLIENLVVETPKTTVFASRLNKLLAKASPIASEGLRTILVDVLAESAKKMLWPG